MDMSNKKKYVAVLSSAALGALILSALSINPAYAKTTGFVVKDAAGKYFEYNYQELLDSSVQSALGNPAPLYEDYLSKTLVAFNDDVNGYVDQQAVIDASVDAAIKGNPFSIDEGGYTESQEAKDNLAQDVSGVKQLTVKDGEVVPVENETGVEVSSVSAINATTLQVVLPTAPPTAPTAGDFNVVIDGQTVAATAVAKAPNETVKYNLTIPTLAGKEGTLKVNGVAATITGSDFGYDFKAPSLASATAVDKNHVLLTFSEKINKATFELATVTNVVDVTDLAGNTLTPTLAKVQADGKSVLVTITTPLDTFKGGYVAVAKDNAGLVDIAGHQTGAANKTIFDGVGTASTTGPVAVNAVYNPDTTSTLVVNFDKAINATVDKTKITVGGVALGLGDTATRTGANNDQLTITLSSTTKAAYEAAASKDVVFAAGAVKDTELTPNDILATTVTPVEASKLTSAKYDEASNALVLNFSKPVNTATFNTTAINFDGNALPAVGTTGNTVSLKETGYSSTLTLDLSRVTSLNTATTGIESVAATSRALVVDSNATNVDVNGNLVADATYTSVLTYVDDVTAPVVSSVSFNATTAKLTVTLSEDVTVTDNTLLAVYDGTNKLFDLNTGSATVANATASTNKQYVITLANPELAAIKAASTSNLTFKVTAPSVSTSPAGLADIAGNKIAASTTAISYTDQDAISLAAQTTQVAADKIQLNFSKQINATDAVNVNNYKVVKTASSPEVVLPVTSAVVSGDGKSVILTLDKTSANYVNGYSYTVTPTVKDTFGNNYVLSSAHPEYSTIASFDTTATATAYALASVTYADTNGDYSYDSGDKLTLSFNGPVSVSGDVVAADFALANATLGTGFTVAQGSTTNTLVVTLGSGAALTGTAFDNSQTLDLATQTHIVGANGIAAVAKGAPVAIAKPDTTRPTLVSATYNDTNGDGTLGQGDTLTVKFSEAVKLANATVGVANSTAPNNDLILDSNGMTLDGTKANVSGDTLTITLASGTNTFVPGTNTLAGDAASDSITDLWGNALDTGAAVTIAKSDTTAPTFSNASIVKGSGNTGSVLEAGDKVVFSVSEPVHLGAYAADALDLYAGATKIGYGVDNSGLFTGGNGSTLANFSNVAVDNVAKTVTVTVAANDGWAGATINAISSFNTNGFVPALSDANGNTMTPASGFGVSVTK